MNMQREQLFRFFFLGVFIFLLYQVMHILSPFYTGILGAIVITLIFYPLHRWLIKLIGLSKKNIAAALSTFLAIVFIVIPFIIFSWLLINELTNLAPQIKQFGNTLEKWRQGEISADIAWIKALELKLKQFLDVSQINVQKIVTDGLGYMVSFVVNLGKKVPKNTFALMINIAVMIFTLFFLFRDGRYLFKRAKQLIPMERRYKDQIANQLYITVTAVVRGVFLVAVAQGILAGLGFLVAGSDSALILGFATVFMALIPLVGAAAIWLPVSLYYLVQVSFWKGICLLIWGFGAVSLVDNFMRPILIGDKAKLPMLFLFFGLLGGIKVYGPMGLFLGPLVIALVIAFIRIYREEYS